MLAWSVVCTSPQQEIRASLEIAKAGFEVFFPLKRYIRHKLNRPPEEVTGPLFPRYVFVRMDRDMPEWAKIREMRGVSDVLRNGYKPVIVRPEIIEAIRDYREPMEAVQAERVFTEGQRVRVASGVLEGIEGLYKGSDRQRTKAFLEILGKKWDVPFDTIAAA